MFAITSLRARYKAALRSSSSWAASPRTLSCGTALSRRSETPDSVVQDIESIAGEWHLLVLTEDWCGDAVNTLPVLAAFRIAPGTSTFEFCRATPTWT